MGVKSFMAGLTAEGNESIAQGVSAFGKLATSAASALVQQQYALLSQGVQNDANTFLTGLQQDGDFGSYEQKTKDWLAQEQQKIQDDKWDPLVKARFKNQILPQLSSQNGDLFTKVNQIKENGQWNQASQIHYKLQQEIIWGKGTAGEKAQKLKEQFQTLGMSAVPKDILKANGVYNADQIEDAVKVPSAFLLGKEAYESADMGEKYKGYMPREEFDKQVAGIGLDHDQAETAWKMFSSWQNEQDSEKQKAALTAWNDIAPKLEDLSEAGTLTRQAIDSLVPSAKDNFYLKAQLSPYYKAADVSSDTKLVDAWQEQALKKAGTDSKYDPSSDPGAAELKNQLKTATGRTYLTNAINSLKAGIKDATPTLKQQQTLERLRTIYDSGASQDYWEQNKSIAIATDGITDTMLKKYGMSSRPSGNAGMSQSELYGYAGRIMKANGVKDDSPVAGELYKYIQEISTSNSTLKTEDQQQKIQDFFYTLSSKQTDAMFDRLYKTKSKDIDVDNLDAMTLYTSHDYDCFEDVSEQNKAIREDTAVDGKVWTISTYNDKIAEGMYQKKFKELNDAQKKIVTVNAVRAKLRRQANIEAQKLFGTGYIEVQTPYGYGAMVDDVVFIRSSSDDNNNKKEDDWIVGAVGLGKAYGVRKQAGYTGTFHTNLSDYTKNGQIDPTKNAIVYLNLDDFKGHPLTIMEQQEILEQGGRHWRRWDAYTRLRENSKAK